MVLAVDARADIVFDTLGNPLRRSIVRMLVPGPKSVGEIAKALPISRPAVSKHLRLLESARLVTHVPVGNRRMFRLQPHGFEEARAWLELFWGDALSRFAIVAENTKPEKS